MVEFPEMFSDPVVVSTDESFVDLHRNVDEGDERLLVEFPQSEARISFTEGTVYGPSISFEADADSNEVILYRRPNWSGGGKVNKTVIRDEGAANKDEPAESEVEGGQTPLEQFTEGTIIVNTKDETRHRVISAQRGLFNDGIMKIRAEPVDGGDPIEISVEDHEEWRVVGAEG